MISGLEMLRLYLPDALRTKSPPVVRQETIGFIANGNGDDANKASVQVYLEPDAKGTVFAFGGIHQGIGMPPSEFHRTLSGTQHNLVFLKDFHQCWYQNGLMGITRSRAETVQFLLQNFNDFQRPWTCIGLSAGGFAALFFGAHIKSDRIVALAPQTRLSRRAFIHYAGNSTDPRIFRFNDPDNDLRATLVDHQSQIFIHYDQNHAVDSEQAQWLSGLKDISFIKHPTGGHNIAKHMRDNGALIDVLLHHTHVGQE